MHDGDESYLMEPEPSAAEKSMDRDADFQQDSGTQCYLYNSQGLPMLPLLKHVITGKVKIKVEIFFRWSEKILKLAAIPQYFFLNP